MASYAAVLRDGCWVVLGLPDMQVVWTPPANRAPDARRKLHLDDTTSAKAEAEAMARQLNRGL